MSEFCPVIDYELEVIECYGVKISAALFKHFSERANEGTNFKFVRNQEGTITVEKLAGTDV